MKIIGNIRFCQLLNYGPINTAVLHSVQDGIPFQLRKIGRKATITIITLQNTLHNIIIILENM